MVTDSKSDDKILRKIVISYSEFDSEIAEEIKNYFEKNKIGNFQVEVDFDEHLLGESDKLISNSTSNVIEGKIDCLLVLFSEKSMNEDWLNRDANALSQQKTLGQSIAVILVNWYVSDNDVPKNISKIQETLRGFKFDKDKGSMGGLLQTLINVVRIEIEEKA